MHFMVAKLGAVDACVTGQPWAAGGRILEARVFGLRRSLAIGIAADF